jgi:hypothetical protein
MTDVAGPLQPRGDGPQRFQPLPISFPPEVMNLVQTCECHPSQWEGWTSDGRVIYVRFRHGRLWIGLAPDYRHTTPAMLFVARYPGDNGDDGYLRYDTLQRLTEGIVDWP